MLLEVNNLHVYYGHIHAIKGISLQVDKGEIVTLIGANGAGKSTTLKTISGLLHPREGGVKLEGQPIDKVPPHEIAAMGIAHVPEGRHIFPRLTAEENLEMGAFTLMDRAVIERQKELVFHLFPRLAERRNQKGGTLSGGEQQMLATGRALMMNPRILLMDEPSMGLAPVLVESIFDTIRGINKEQGTTILLVEQNALMALGLASRGYVLQTGEIVLQDTSVNLQSNEMVRHAYLGEQ
jgi:branched-chain amino acid transport system ATP-binding protein